MQRACRRIATIRQQLSRDEARAEDNIWPPQPGQIVPRPVLQNLRSTDSNPSPPANRAISPQSNKTQADPSAADSEARKWKREYYNYFMVVQTRWSDNDMYGHVNNVMYYSWMDTIINQYLITEGGLRPAQGDQTNLGMSSSFQFVISTRNLLKQNQAVSQDVIGLAVESGCTFKASLAFPEQVTCGLRVARLGRSSVVYEVGIFGQGEPEQQRNSPAGIAATRTTPTSDAAQTAAAVGRFVHVFVKREDRRPTDMPHRLRSALERLT